MPEQQTESIATLVERAVASYEALVARAQAVEDEWQYVADLEEAYLPAIRALGAGREAETAVNATVAAVDEAIAEIELIEDPHKAIDWLSTFPHILALAVGGSVDEEAEASGRPIEAPAGEDEGFDDDSPFRILLGRDP